MISLDETVSKVLVIDDDVITRKTISKMLSQSGCTVYTKPNGVEGIECAQEVKPDIILLDVMMPLINGYQTCVKLRELFDHNEVKIIMLTGMNDGSSVDRAFDAGANDFIVKPINWQLLVKRVRYALRERYMHYQLVENEAMLKQSQRMAGITYWEFDPETDQVTFSGVFADEHLENVKSITKDRFFEMVHDEDRELIHKEFCRICLHGGSYHKDLRIHDKKNNEMIYQQQAEAMFGSDGYLIRIIGTLQDVTKEHHAAALIEYQKYYDDLTGAPNKSSHYRDLDTLLSRNKDSELIVVLFIGLDRFKSINNSLGYKIGDEILKQSVERIKAAIDEHCIVCRYSGDGFTVIVKGLKNLGVLEVMLRLILKSMSDPFVVENEEIYLSCSIGIAVSPLEDGDAVHLTECAENAMNQAKTSGGNQYCYHSVNISQTAINKREVEKQIRYAIEYDKFMMVYQPQIDLRTGACIGAEALIRMEGQHGEIISPLDFIPVAEETGLIVEIGYWIINVVCKQINTWESMGMNNLRIGINLSARQFNDPGLVNKIKEAVDKYKVPKQCIDLEITESTMMDDMVETQKILTEFKNNGFTISMDDFGTGYSSLSYLQKMPIDILKIDRAFIKDIGENGDNSEIAKTIIAMGHALNMVVIAEGAETKDHMSFLHEELCDEVQGYYYSPPLEVNKFNEFYYTYVSGFEKSVHCS
ncbi:MAG: EAL domain-containing protein [Gammaproteobacteria bacterium]|nr:EAL domain-containing protein [Gammaproteobacteria bacterium]